ncbi:hypothetical protein [Nocardioides plantarum]|uniref:Uncharacterized protein n=1 Tax=Nocardioides plantarum TaxID=29299 RepID=A0ABV5KB16_9ACTN|nr:hypothetical protein [Nocardioides plantarum]
MSPDETWGGLDGGTLDRCDDDGDGAQSEPAASPVALSRFDEIAVDDAVVAELGHRWIVFVRVDLDATKLDEVESMARALN